MDELLRRKYCEALHLIIWHQKVDSIDWMPASPQPSLGQVWRMTEDVEAGNADMTLSVTGHDPDNDDQVWGWEKLEAKVATCTACQLHETRTQTVFGVGNKQAEIMIIGEAPGFYEDKQGEPFVGRAGQLLTSMLKCLSSQRKLRSSLSIPLAREDVYIANVLKCRPPNNRDPLPDEVKLCTGYLNKQIALIKPRLLIALGRIASHYLLKTTSSLEQLRNKLHHYGETRIPLIVTYHPAYLLRNPKDKKKAFSDLKFIQRSLS